MKTETKFGLNQIGNHSPKWATWIFRISLYICSFLILALTTLNVGRIGLNSDDVKDLTAALSLIIMAIHALTRMIGQEIKPEEYEIR